MRLTTTHALAALAVTIGVTGQAWAAQPRHAGGDGIVVIPQSSIRQPGEAGLAAHTHIRLFVPAGVLDPAKTPQAQPESGYFFEPPASLACVYRLGSYSSGTPLVSGCNPNSVTTAPTGGSKTIAIVDAYDDQNAASDLATFSSQFNLPSPNSKNFQVVYASGSRPQRDSSGGWELEESLDIEWAHAMAPGANIILVEAASNSISDLMKAESKAAQLVANAGGGEVSNSWGSAEFSGQQNDDSYFIKNTVTFFASTGDSPGVEWPSTSANVIAVGGTSLARNPITGNFIGEATWADASSGISEYTTLPSYQAGVAASMGVQSGAGGTSTMRGVPDIAAVANPTTGVWVYDSVSYEGERGGWIIVGGTSVASPVSAAIVNNAGSFAASSAAELATIYANGTNAADFNDIVKGTCGPNSGYFGIVGWDLCTGFGSPNTTAGK